ncbi:uncharacterized protein LOC133292902 [Gastrolobium bilobum]|uniref:uncharacterized protein LOC133292902 n=1 Tax=Gastrolobium bilobum TaxID=150636 RepID=UPI002AAFD254|nr:uncharacterized protein LOC133292902 [Gastrolobium bilobum]
MSLAEFHFNTAFNRSTGMTPFEITFGHKPPNLLAYTLGSSTVDAIGSDLSTREHILCTLRDNLFKSQNAMKAFAYKKRKEKFFKVGDWVLLRLQPHRQLSVARRSSQKLAQRFYGPYQILEMIGQVFYRLQLPKTSRIHNVFHVSLLRPFHADFKLPRPPAPLTALDGPPIHYPQAVVGNRLIWRQGQEIPQVLVKWEGLPLEDCTWEDEFTIMDLVAGKPKGTRKSATAQSSNLSLGLNPKPNTASATPQMASPDVTPNQRLLYHPHSIYKTQLLFPKTKSFSNHTM